MARPKVLTRKKGNHSADNMLEALKLHRRGMSIRKVAKERKIAYPTLRRYVAKNVAVPLDDLMKKRLTPNYENRMVFTTDQEDELKAYIVDCAQKFYGLTVKDCRKVAYQMAKLNKISIPDSWEKEKIAGKEWFRSFKKRHADLSVKKPEACSLARATAFNRETVKTFFDNLKGVMERHPSFGSGCRLFNLDETATTTVQRPSKVVAPKGNHNLSKITSGEKGTLVTTCAIVCAAGHALPPAMVFPRKNLKDLMLIGAPPGTLGLTHKTGWMTSELFVDVMKHFIKHSGSSPENPALLILDNHESHLCIEALDLAKSSGVTILTLHPHTTAKMQPLDVGLNAPFKAFYNNAVDSWMMRHPGSAMTIYNVAECVGVAYARAMTPVNIASAFKKCGIFPYNADVFTDLDFLPSEVTDRPQQEEPAIQEQNDDTSLMLDIDTNSTDCEDMERMLSPSVMDMILDEPVNLAQSRTPAPSPTPQCSKELPMVATCDNTAQVLPIQKTDVVKFMSPKQFMPPLKAGPRKNTRKMRKKGRSRVVTDTPEKTEILEDRNKKQGKNVAIKKVKRPVLKDAPKKKKSKKVVPVVVESSSEEEIEEIVLSSETELSEFNSSDDEETFPVIGGNFEKLTRKPVADDFVMVAFDMKKTKIYYIAKVIEICAAGAYGVSFMRLKNKQQMKFVMPIEPDLSEVPDIKLILPPPKVNGTKLRSSTFSFSVRVAPTINLR